MLPMLASGLTEQAVPTWRALIVPLLTILIYGVLCPAVYVNILFLGIELAVPRGTRMRQVLQARLPPRPTAWTIADNDPYFHFLCGVGGLLALAMWSLVVTTWLSGYLHRVPAPQLSPQHASAMSALAFVVDVALGLVGGYAWASGMRLARDGRACLIVVAVSMSLSGSALFFYLVEPGTRDLLLVLALGTFVGELMVAARHPTLWREGLYGELLRAPGEPATPQEGAAPEEAELETAVGRAGEPAGPSWPPQPSAARTSERRGASVATDYPSGGTNPPAAPRPIGGHVDDGKP